MVEKRQGLQTAGSRVSITLIIIRLLICSFAFFLAVIAAGLVAIFGLYRGLEGDAAYAGVFLGTAVLIILLAAQYALAPFAVIVVLAEAFAVRNIFLFVGAGMLIGAGFAWSEIGDQVTFEDRRLLIAAAAGIVGGFVYWLIAGRHSGSYRERIYMPANAPASPEASEQNRP